MAEFRVEFFWTTSRGTRKTAMTIVGASSENSAVQAARAEIASDYGITGLRLKNVRLFNN